MIDYNLLATSNQKINLSILLSANNTLKEISILKLLTCNSIILNTNKCGSTTVASTIMIADMVGIKVFATGGIGGVHRDSNYTYDISSDLKEDNQL